MRSFTRWFRKRPRTARPAVTPAGLGMEELEARWNPGATSTNWSGYAVSAAAQAVTAVSGEWTVPTVTGTGTAYSSVWVGIDGYTSNSVEQTGIEADVVNGVAQYSAWYEMYPNGPVTVNVPIHPGDTISASVTYSATTGKFTLTVADVTDNASFSTSQSAPGAQRSSAEWIVEAPSSSTGVLRLANFGSATISNAQATINGTTGAINAPAWASQATSINMVSSAGTVEASTSGLTANGEGFTVTYGAATSPPPVSPPPSPPASPPPPVSPPPAPVSPPPAPVSPPPAPASVATTTTLVGRASGETRTGLPTVTLTATVSPAVPVGSWVALLDGTTVLGYGRVHRVGGADEVSFVVAFSAPGTYVFTAEYLGAGADAASVSNAVTVTVTAAAAPSNPSTGSWLPPGSRGRWHGW